MQEFLIKQLIERFGNARAVVKEKMNSIGVADRWPAVLASVEEILGTQSMPLTQFLATKSEPLMSWINAEIMQFDDHQMEVKMRLAPHLLVGGSWDLSVFTGSAYLPIKWLIEKHAPPGKLKLGVSRMEMQNESPILEGILFARTSVVPDELETFLKNLVQNGKAQFEAHVSFYSTQEKRMAQVQMTVDCEWQALLQKD
jgi:hypothetical protein